MKKGLSTLFGDYGRLVWAVLLSAASLFLFPVFVDLARQSSILAKIGAVFSGIFVVGFLFSSIFCGIEAIFKAFRQGKLRWLWLTDGVVIVIFNIMVIIMGII